MRIALQIIGDINAISGGYLYDRKLVHYLQSQGDQVEIISLKQRSYLSQCLNNEPPDKLLKGNFDLVIQDEMIHPAVYRMNRQFRNQSNTPIIGLVHLLGSSVSRDPFTSRFHRQIESRYLRTVDGLILNSNSTLQLVQQMVEGDMPPHVVALPAGDNFPGFSGQTNSADLSGMLNILFVGNITRQKSLDVLLSALATLPRDHFKLTVIGRQDMEPDYVIKVQSLIHSLKLQQQVTLTGPVCGDALAREYTRHQVLVLPSVNEAFGIVYLEAMQFGLPVIGTSAGGAKEIIRHAENGYLIEPGDNDQLARHLLDLQQNPALLGAFSNQSRTFYTQHPTWQQTGEAIRQFLYGQMINVADD